MPELPPQVYATTLFDRERSRQLRFVVVPARSMPTPAEDPLDVAHRLGLDRYTPGRPYVTPVEGWSLPFLLDAFSGSYR